MVISFIFIVLCILIFAIGFLVLLKNSRAVVNRSFAGFLLGIVVMTLGFFFMAKHYPFDLFDKLIHYGGLLILFSLLIFSKVFPDQDMSWRQVFVWAIPYITIALFVVPFDLLIREAPFDEFGKAQPSNGPLLLPYMIFSGLSILLSLFFIVRSYRRTKGQKRMQMNYLITGFSVFMASLFVFSLMLPVFGISYLNTIGIVSSVFFIGLTAVAIIRHQLLDIRIVIQRGLIYFVLLTLIALIYIIGLQFVSYFVHQVTNLGIILTAGVTMVLGILFFHPLDLYLRRLTDPIFFKNKYDYAEAMHELSRILNMNLSQADVVTASSRALRNIFKTNTVAFRIFEEKADRLILNSDIKDGRLNTQVHCEPGESLGNLVQVPIIFEGTPIGLIELGPKLSGESYDTCDYQLLETFTHQASVALEKGRLYEKVQSYTHELEHLVDKRTKEIKDLQEEQEQTMIDISHNLQTPLTVIQGELDFLTEVPACREKAHSFKKSVERVSRFISQLLYLAHLGKMDELDHFKKINLSKLILGQIEYFEVMAEEGRVKLKHDIMPDIWLNGDSKLLEEMLINLVSNALKYRRSNVESEVAVTLLADQEGIKLTISDNGLGIAADDLPKIFSRFYRAANVSNLSSGVGLGLAIVKQIVEKHQGRISVQSTPGQGTEFLLTFRML